MAGIGGTVADLLSAMSLLNNEFQVSSGDPQEAKAILALKHTQHWFESLAATYPDVLQDTITITATVNVESSAWTSALLRIDGMQYLDANGVPIGPMYRIEDVGGHVPSLPMPIQLLSAPALNGAPFAYYGNLRNFYWMPKPDAAGYGFRVYGFLEAPEFTLRTDDFNYPKRLILPFANFATALMQISVDDDKTDLDQLGAQLFKPAIHQLRYFDRSAPHSRHYTEFHTT